MIIQTNYILQTSKESRIWCIF